MLRTSKSFIRLTAQCLGQHRSPVTVGWWMSQGPRRPSLFWKGTEAKPDRLEGHVDLKFGFQKGKRTTLNHSDPVIFGRGRSLPSSDIQESSPWSLDERLDCCRFQSGCMFQSRHQISQQISDSLGRFESPAFPHLHQKYRGTQRAKAFRSIRSWDFQCNDFVKSYSIHVWYLSLHLTKCR